MNGTLASYTEWFLETETHAFSDLPPSEWLEYDDQMVELAWCSQTPVLLTPRHMAWSGLVY